MSTIETVKQVLLASGAGWVLWFLGALSVASLALAVERWLYLRRRGGDLEALARKLDPHLTRASSTARARARGEPAVAARVADAGLRLAARGTEAADKAMQSAAALERRSARTGACLSRHGGEQRALPRAVRHRRGRHPRLRGAGHSAPGHGATAAGQVASQAVMASIAEALVATAVGIFVALPSVALYNYLQRRVTSLLAGAEVLTNLVLAYIAEVRVGRTGSRGARRRRAGAAAR